MVSRPNILVSKANDYGLVRFDSMEDAQHAFYTLMTWQPSDFGWVVDFEPLDVSVTSATWARTLHAARKQ